MSAARLRAAARAILRELPAGTLQKRLDAARAAVHEAALAEALDAAEGSRSGAAEALGVSQPRVSEWIARFPALAARWPAQMGRPPSK